MTRDEAIALYDSQWWVGKTPAEIFEFQINEPKLCMPFGDFQAAAESALGRPVFTHEFADPQSLLDEFHKRRAAKTLPEIMAELPADKTIVVTP